jgi:hypothetical protein
MSSGDEQFVNIPAFDPIIVFHRPRFWALECDCYAIYEVKIGQLGYTDTWDWIGLYPRSFRSLTDWVAYNYASPCRRTGIPKAVTFTNIFKPGKYRLVYVGARNSVLGMSEEFYVGRYAVDELAEEATEESS